MNKIETYGENNKKYEKISNKTEVERKGKHRRTYIKLLKAFVSRRSYY